MLSCKEASIMLSAAQERKLNWRERFGLKLHLIMCDGCTQFRRQLDLLRIIVKRYRDRDETP